MTCNGVPRHAGMYEVAFKHQSSKYASICRDLHCIQAMQEGCPGKPTWPGEIGGGSIGAQLVRHDNLDSRGIQDLRSPLRVVCEALHVSVIGQPKVSWLLVWEKHGWIGVKGRDVAFRGSCCERTAGCSRCKGAGYAAVWLDSVTPKDVCQDSHWQCVKVSAVPACSMQ